MKKNIFLFLFVLLPLMASADAVKINGIFYNLISKGKVAEVTRNPNGYSGSVVIPKSVVYEGTKYKVKTIGYGAFDHCTGLTSITIPSSVTGIDSYAFYDCTSLGSVHISDIGSWCKISFNGTDSNPLYCAHHLFVNGEEVKDMVIPNSVTSIGDDAFVNCTGLTSVTIPSSVTSIGNYAFEDCSGLTSVTIGNGVTSIGERAFSMCSGLNSIKVEAGNVKYDSRDNCNAIIETESNTLITGCNKTTIPNSVTSIGRLAFKGSRGLISVKIPSSVTSIGVGAFENCSGLTSVKIPSSVTSIEAYVFHGCSSLTAVTVPNGVTGIGYSAFMGCSSLTSFTIPNSVTTIDFYAFWGCKSLTSITIPNSVTTIGGRVFWDCGISQVISKIEDPFGINTDTFSENTFSNATLYVPVGSLEKYEAANGWKKFAHKEKLTAKLKLDKSIAVIEKGKTLTLKATLSPTKLIDKSVTWKSSNTKVATVTSSGKVKGVKAGTVTITCTSVATGAKATCNVTVGYVKLDQAEAILEKTKTMTLTATVYPSKLEDKSVTWKSSNTKVATVSSKGKVKGVKAGTATITCTSNATGLSTTCNVTVGYVKLDQTEVSVKKGKTVTLTPTVYPSKLEDKSVTWTSSNTKVATVTADGKVKGVKTGTATITCTSNATGLSRSCEVTVVNLTLDQYEVTVKKGKTVTLTATVYPSTLEDKSVTWESSDTKIATVTSAGKVKGIRVGTATITCTSVATGLSRTCKVTVIASSSSRSLEGDDDGVTGIETVEEAPALAEPFDVYDLSGRKVLDQVNSLDGLPAGVYIVNGKKMLKK